MFASTLVITTAVNSMHYKTSKNQFKISTNVEQNALKMTKNALKIDLTFFLNAPKNEIHKNSKYCHLVVKNIFTVCGHIAFTQIKIIRFINVRIKIF